MIVEYQGRVDLWSWRADDVALEVQVQFAPPGMTEYYTRYHRYSAYNGSNWMWAKCKLTDNKTDRSPLSTYEGSSEQIVPALLDKLVLGHPKLKVLAKLYGYDPSDEKIKDELDKVIKASAS